MHGFAHDPLVPLCDKSWELSRGVTIGRCRFLAWWLVARGARVFVDSMLPLVFVPSRFLHANRSHRWRRNSFLEEYSNRR
eukprot:COSAG02_NODE_1696_length_11261_cov_132.993639_14_plen_80_part_00